MTAGHKLILPALLAGLTGAVPGCAKDKDKPARRAGAEPAIEHVVLISIDTMRADHLGCYGNAQVKTPHVDTLAAEGIRFDQVVTAAPTTLAAHTSIMTGAYTHTHGVVRNGFVVSDDNVMLAEILKEEGFATAAVIGAFALDERFGFAQGFDRFDQEYDRLVEQMGDGQNQRRADQVTDAAIALLDASIPDRTFLFVHYFDPHAPYDPPAPYDTLYPRPDGRVGHSLRETIEPAIARQQKHTIGRSLGMATTIKRGLGRALLERASGEPIGDDLSLAALYCGEVSYLDHHLGCLCDDLRRRGIFDRALIIVTGDHGETMWEHGDFWNHGLWVYDTTVRVPLIVRLPGGKFGGTVVQEAVSTIDIMPSILALLGLDYPEDVEGKSLVPAWTGRPFNRGPVFSEATQPYRVGRPADLWANARKAKCVREGPWKYILAPYLDYEELYNIEGDPAERINMLHQPTQEAANRAATMRQALEAWNATAAPHPSVFARRQRDDSLRKLRSLGYVGGTEDDAQDNENASAVPDHGLQTDLDELRSLPYAGAAPDTADDDRNGVITCDPTRSCPGYNLYSIHRASRAELINDQGRLVHSWSYSPSRAWSNCELLPNGDLLVVGVEPPRQPHPMYADEERYIMRFNWSGELLWKHNIPAHHDVEVTPRDQLLTLTFKRRVIPAIHPEIDTRDDQLTLLDHDGHVLESLSLYEAFAAKPDMFVFQDVKPMPFGDGLWVDLFHANSVEWMHWTHLRGQHAIYEPGNVLICSRHQDVVAVVNYDKRELVWTWGRGELSGPHDAQVLETGHILVFDNGIDPRRQWSRVVELDPVSNEIVWQYQAPDRTDFYTLSKGSSQRLPNGNTLIASSDQGRAFETTPDGDIVWEFLCPHRNRQGERTTVVRMKRYKSAYVDAIRGAANGPTAQSAH